jgi:hypothetical protein
LGAGSVGGTKARAGLTTRDITAESALVVVNTGFGIVNTQIGERERRGRDHG